MVEGLGKAVVHGYMWVWVGACWHGWIHVGGVSVRRVRAMGAHGEGLSTCIGGQGVARYGRSAVGSHEVKWRQCGLITPEAMLCACGSCKGKIEDLRWHRWRCI